MSSLLSRLGLGETTRALIIVAQGLGLSHATNAGVLDALEGGLVTSASLMVPCPWARHGLDSLRGFDIGVSLTLTAPWAHYRYGPITHAPSLFGGDGGFPPSAQDLWDHADLDEVARECHAQLERAREWGVDVTHLEADSPALTHRPEFFDIYLDLALESGLPLLLPEVSDGSVLGFPMRTLARDAGVVFPDFSISGHGRTLSDLITSLLPGVSVIHLSPAQGTPELFALDPFATQRVGDREALCSNNALFDVLKNENIHLIGYRALRTL
jgi:chitin disaccharide deacetylase